MFMKNSTSITDKNFGHFMRTKRSTCSNYAFDKYVKEVLHVLSSRMNFIRWNRRLELNNHHEAFPARVTGIVDTFPVVVECGDSEVGRLLYNPKYKAHVIKCAHGIQSQNFTFSRARAPARRRRGERGNERERFSF